MFLNRLNGSVALAGLTNTAKVFNRIATVGLLLAGLASAGTFTLDMTGTSLLFNGNPSGIFAGTGGAAARVSFSTGDFSLATVSSRVPGEFGGVDETISFSTLGGAYLTESIGNASYSNTPTGIDFLLYQYNDGSNVLVQYYDQVTNSVAQLIFYQTDPPTGGLHPYPFTFTGTVADLSQAFAYIEASQSVLVFGANSQAVLAGLSVATPEPSTWGSLILGVCMMAGLARKKVRAAGR